jgi:DKCLD (NUC011) domain.
MNRSLIYRERDYKIKLFIKPYYKRDLNEHLNLSFCLLDKPKGPTSHEVAAWIKK